MNPIYIPGPNNELILATPPDTSSRFPINGDFATSASYAATSSYFVGYIESSSYAKFAETASYLLGSIQNAISASWAALAGHAQTAISASYALYASYAGHADTSDTASHAIFSETSATASFVLTASYSYNSSTASYLQGTSSYARFAETASYALTSTLTLTISGSTSGAYMSGYEVDTFSDPTIIDSFPATSGRSAKWILSIYDGTNLKTSELMAVWNATTETANFAEATTNVIGTIPVSLSVNVVSGVVRLVANPASGTWSARMIRFLL
jgi:hypothetical protein